MLILLALGAAPPSAPSPPPPRPAPPPPQLSVWQQIQPALDRSNGRILDDTSYDVARLNYMRDQRLGLVPDVRNADLMRFEYERSLRIEQRNREMQFKTDRARREELDLREYELTLHTGLFAAGADEDALNAAKARRDGQLIDADNQRTQALREAPANRAQIDAAYSEQIKRIRQQYDRERARIFDLPSAAATQPSP